MPGREAYFCGEWIAESQLSIPVGDPGFTLGVTVTERLRTFARQVFRQEEHLRRMARSLEVIGLESGAIVAELRSALEEYPRRHADQWQRFEDWGLVAFVTPGTLRPTVCVHGYPLPFQEWRDSYREGVKLWVSEHRQVPPNCWPAELKCRSRMHYYLADLEARQAAPRARALLLDQEGYVGEASTANVVVYQRDKGLSTPKFTKVLPGVSVGVVAELAQELGLPFTERDIALEELKQADEVWLSSTSVCLLPVVECDGETIGEGGPGEVFGRMVSAWGEMVGVEILRQGETGRP